MKSALSLLVLVPLLALNACAVPLSEGGRTIAVVKSSVPQSCKAVGLVHGHADGLDNVYTLERAKNEMRNRAAAMGATHVKLENAQLGNGEVSGVAYDCHLDSSPASSE